MKGHCGLINQNASCRCHLRIKSAIRKGRIDPEHLLFIGPKQFRDGDTLTERVEEMEKLHETAAIYRSQPEYEVPELLFQKIREILDSDKYQILN